jgi:hypothetical protein
MPRARVLQWRILPGFYGFHLLVAGSPRNLLSNSSYQSPDNVKWGWGSSQLSRHTLYVVKMKRKQEVPSYLNSVSLPANKASFCILALAFQLQTLGKFERDA